VLSQLLIEQRISSNFLKVSMLLQKRLKTLSWNFLGVLNLLFMVILWKITSLVFLLLIQLHSQFMLKRWVLEKSLLKISVRMKWSEVLYGNLCTNAVKVKAAMDLKFQVKCYLNLHLSDLKVSLEVLSNWRDSTLKKFMQLNLKIFILRKDINTKNDELNFIDL